MSEERLEEEMKTKCARKLKDTQDPLERLRLALLSKGASSIKGIGRKFRIMDDDGSKTLSYDEFKKGLIESGVRLDEKDMKEVFDRFDDDKNGSLSFDEFLRHLRPPMSASRVRIIELAFAKLDKTGDGVVTVEDLRGVYCAKDHPKYRSGKWTEEQVFLNFLKTFDSPNDPDGKVTKEEFLNYYSGVSASVDTDAYFDLMMRKAWKI